MKVNKAKIKRLLLVALTDSYSKWPELAFSCSANTTDVIQFISSVFSPHGNPENIVRDNGTVYL